MLKKLTTAIANYYYFLKGKVIPSRISNGKDIPIIINNFNRLTTLIQLTDSLTSRGYTRIYILDNASTYPPLLAYYQTCPFTVIRLKENLGFKALWKSEWKKGFAMIIILTDSDVVTIADCPTISSLFPANAERQSTSRKIGFSLGSIICRIIQHTKV